ncbi:hypothetical protein RFI_37315 [Reticulomyxa filosa]|uniref:Uncharacterized protein n=1 Tax=Reticulomyxa filosa TaxID=46433 RepID=X6LEZ2_RETFI|nr:hypothetical protein RFI_37315 [Reticulomyxa filosa]|eukprot:ETO00144.1 hypothetical protein RFI_37315 [Reticulomyxa filosa]
MRNLGGYKESEFQKALRTALARAKRIPKNEIPSYMDKYTPMKCVELNLKDLNCRHCMLICKTPSSWQMLLDHNVLQYTNTVYLFESKFAADTTTMTNYDHLHKIINCMEMGKTVVLYNLKGIHECLYDMLNQRYKTNSQGIYIYILYNIYTYIYILNIYGGKKKMVNFIAKLQQTVITMNI